MFLGTHFRNRYNAVDMKRKLATCFSCASADLVDFLEAERESVVYWYSIQ
jgi:hypothetical protein